MPLMPAQAEPPAPADLWRVAWTAHAAATTDLRNEGRLELSGTFQAGAFDTFSHTADMRRIAFT